MPTQYYNASGAGDFLEADGATYTWGAGSDSNDGASRLTPFLTANPLDDLPQLVDQLGDPQYFNQGTYEFTEDQGRCIVDPGINIVSAQESYDTPVIIRFVGTGATQGFRTLSAGSNNRQLSVGTGIIFECSGTIEDLIHLNTNSSTGTYTTFFDCKLRAVGSTVDGLLVTAGTQSPSTFQFDDNFSVECSDATVSLSNVINIQRTDTLFVNFTDDSFNINWTAGSILTNVFFAVYQEATATQPSNFVTPKGTLNVVNPGGNFYIIRALNPPSESVLKQVGNFDVTYANPSNVTSNFIFQTDSTAAITDLLMYRPLEDTTSIVTTNAQEGYLFLIGSDGDTDDPTVFPLSGNIVNVEATAGAAEAESGAIHGVMSGACNGGLRTINKVTGCNIGSLTKNGVGNSKGNQFIDLGGFTAEACFGKATDPGVVFRGDRNETTRENVDLQHTKVNRSGLQVANTPLFDGLHYISNGGFTGGVTFHLDGDGSDASEGDRQNLYYNSGNIGLNGQWLFRGGARYNLDDSLSLPSNPFTNVVFVGDDPTARAEVAAADTALATEIISDINAGVPQLSPLSAEQEGIIRSRINATSLLSYDLGGGDSSGVIRRVVQRVI